MKKKTVSLLLSLAVCLTMLPGQGAFAAETSTETETETAAETEAASEAASETETEAASEAASEAETEGTSESTGKHVENLVIGTIADQNVFNSLTQSDAFGRMNYNGFTQGDFVYRDENNNLQPYFWKSFKISDDGKQIDFTIPLDAVWHDGEPVTMDDVVFTFEYMRDVKKVGSLQNLTEVKVTGDDSASLIFSEPDAYYWINSSCNNNACVYAKHIWEGIDDPTTLDGPEAAIGCGPYKLVSYDSDAQVSYYEAVPQDAYLGEITVDKVTVQSYSDETTLMMAMMNGEIDAMYNYANPIDADVIDTVKGTEDIDLGESDFTGCYQMEYGKDRAPGNDQAFREAASYAIDYNQLATTINGEYGKVPGKGVIPPSCKGYDDSLGSLEFDADKAAQMLDEAGYKDVDGDGYRELPDGSPMDLSVVPQYSSKSMDMRNRIAEVIMNSLDKVGIKNHVDSDSISNSEIWEDTVTKGDYDISITLTTSGMASYSTAFRYFMGDLRDGESSWLWGTIHDDTFRDTYYAMSQAINDDQYIENCQKLQQYVAETMSAEALCWETAFFPYRTDKYTGWENYPSWGAVHATTWYRLTAK